MKRFALVVSIVGFVACVVLAAATYLLPLSSPVPLYVLFAGVFLAFMPAVFAHPSASFSGGHASVSFVDTVKSAPRWTTVLLALSVVYVILCGLLLGEDGFAINRAELAGRPDRYRTVVAVCAAFYAAALHVAASALAVERRLLALWRSA